MKANKVPEKIHIGIVQNSLNIYKYITCSKDFPNAVEYTRTDAFIEKACEFLKSYRQDTYDGMAYIPGIVNDETIEDFKKYMKGE